MTTIVGFLTRMMMIVMMSVKMIYMLWNLLSPLLLLASLITNSRRGHIIKTPLIKRSVIQCLMKMTKKPFVVLVCFHFVSLLGGIFWIARDDCYDFRFIILNTHLQETICYRSEAKLFTCSIFVIEIRVGVRKVLISSRPSWGDPLLLKNC